MRHKTYMTLTTWIFAVVGLVHLYRALNNIPLMFGSTSIPVVASWIGGAVALYIAYNGYKNGK